MIFDLNFALALEVNGQAVIKIQYVHFVWIPKLRKRMVIAPQIADILEFMSKRP